MNAHDGGRHEMTQLATIARLRHCHLKNNQKFGGTMLSYILGSINVWDSYPICIRAASAKMVT
jgi:hypothetical protein